MFVKSTRRRRGDKVYEYLSLVESVRDGSKVGHRTLLRLGEVTSLRESGQLERIVAALERHLGRERVDVGALAAEGAPGVGAVAAVWQRLGLGGWFAAVGARRGAAVLEDAVFAMVANRLVAPCSKPESTDGVPRGAVGGGVGVAGWLVSVVFRRVDDVVGVVERVGFGVGGRVVAVWGVLNHPGFSGGSYP